MDKVKFNKILIDSIIVLTIFLIDRFSKIYIIKMAELGNVVDIYLTPFLNFYLIWNKGIAFGLFSFNEKFIYNIITSLIIIVSIIVLMMAAKSEGFKRVSLLFVLGGAIGNLFDRVYYSAVPDFIDFHIRDFHWFIFNVADMFITLGIICLILGEIFVKNIKYEKND
ncbi:signal peptidase II [Candidatus Pelagibacter sp. Uisw_092]|uniref:signal peptidase II n=1 Tax=Candidatus Pelagibacter sp. Uisw_092 TaxID=3230979 RepID=UPI0039EC339B